MNKKVALVLSGGGAKGAFQMAAEKYARVEKGYRWDVIAGVSVGALNATMLAMQEYQLLEEIWNTVSRDKVMTGKANWWTYLKMLLGKKSLYGNEPLWKMIQEEVEPEKIKIPLKIGAVSLRTGKYEAYRPTHSGFKKLVLASTTIPIVWEPVQISHNLRDMVDGGVRNVSPLGDVIDEDPDEIIIINCSKPEPAASDKPLKNALGVAMRTVDILTNEIFITDLREFLRINQLVKQAAAQNLTLCKLDGQPYKYFQCHLIQPEIDLGDTLDFSQPTIQKRIKAGWEQAKENWDE